MHEASTLPPPTGEAGLTDEWLSVAITRGEGSVVDASRTAVGTGQIADSIRVELTWDPPDAGPSSVVVKVTSSAAASRAAAANTRTYEVEVGFYRDLAPDLPVHAPRCYWAGHDRDTGGYAVVLEDMAPAVQGDQIAGCSVDDAAGALDEAALLHGARWGDTAILGLPWIGGGLGGPGMAGLIAALAPGFLERYGDRLAGEVVPVIERYHEAVAAGPAYEGPRTIVHNDFRNDNLLFGGPRVCVLDWQTVSTGAGVLDASYFLGGSLLPEERREHEDALVRGYHRRLTSAGVELSWDECWRQYRLNAFAGLTMAIVASSMVVRTERGDAMFIAMAERAAMHAIDLETEALLREG